MADFVMLLTARITSLFTDMCKTSQSSLHPLSVLLLTDSADINDINMLDTLTDSGTQTYFIWWYDTCDTHTLISSLICYAG